MRKTFLACAVCVPLFVSAQTTPQWRLVEVWRKGGEVEGPYAFDGMLQTRATSIASAPDGRIVVLDATASRVHIFDTTGKLVRSIAREGSGPGEFRAARGIAVAPDGRIFVLDGRNSRLVIYAANGDFERTVTMVRRPPYAFDVTWDGSFDRSGRLFQSLPVLPQQPSANRGTQIPGDSSLMTERVSVDLLRSDSLPMCHAPLPATRDPAKYYTRTIANSGIRLENQPAGTPPPPIAASWPIPFTEQRPEFVRDRDGLTWAPRANASNEILRTSGANCAPAARVVLRGTRAPIPSRIRDSVIADVQTGMKPLIPREFPWYRALRVDDENRLWVERDVAGGRRFDVFAASGQAVAEVDVPAALAKDLPVVIAHGRVYGFVKDSGDVPYLVAWKIVAPGR